MKLSEIYDQLVYGELTQLAVAGANLSGVEDIDHKKMVTHINMALTELHKRFSLHKGEVTVKMYEQIQTYYLDRRFAVTNTSSDEPIKYIDDSQFEPFHDNVLHIERVINENGDILFKNDDTEYWAVHTPHHNAIAVPYPDNENVMHVIYRADHPRISHVDLVPETTDISLSWTFMEPLILYVAYRFFITMPANNGVSQGASFKALFEASIKKIEELNLTNRDNTIFDKIAEGNWV